mmetsp:Transcript_114112/g.317462  ORF Transcript_114112/g.317462 Transcript_114112/m.317462 type:complete len:153 (-) Transcript_114112:203-661(-)
MSLIASPDFQHILRILNTNVDGRQRVMYALTAVVGLGRRLSNIICKKADVDMTKRAGELTPEEIEKVVAILQNPLNFKIPAWMLNRQRDFKTGKNMHLYSNGMATTMRDDLERLKKIRNHRGLRHFWGLRVKGQHTKTTGRRGKTVGVAGKK